MSRVSIDDIAKLFGMPPDTVLDMLRDNHVVPNAAVNRLWGYRFSGGDLERVGKALRNVRDDKETVAEIEIADIEKVTDLPHATVCKAYGLSENAETLPAPMFHEGIEEIARLRGLRRRADELKWLNDTNRACRERNAAKAEATELKEAIELVRADAQKEKERADSLEKKLAKANAAISNQDKVIGNKEREVESLRAQLATLRSTLSQTQSELRGCQEELSRGQSEFIEQASRLANSSLRVTELEEQIKELRRSQPSRDELNVLKMRAAEFWNRWLDADESVCNRVGYTVQVLAKTLSKRQEAAYQTLFGTGISSYSQLREDTDLLNLMKQLGFGNDIHPDGYTHPGVTAYYTLRYELGYAFEYYEIYRRVFATLGDGGNVGVLSMGCGQGLDYWGLRCAQTALNRRDVPVRWHGIDLETWPDQVLNDDTSFYEYGTDLLDFIRHEDALRSSVLMLPKIISELSMDVIERLAEWLERVEYTEPVHYLCIAHTEKNRLGGLYEYDVQGFEESVAVKSAKLIDAFIKGAGNQGYVNLGPVSPDVINVQDSANAPKLISRQYRVKWSSRMAERKYDFLAYETSLSTRNVVVGGIKPFGAEMQTGFNVRDIGKECCPDFVAANGGDCASEGKHGGCPKQCPLYRKPRFMTDRMAYQIYRVEWKRPKHLELLASKAPAFAPNPKFDEDIPF